MSRLQAWVKSLSPRMQSLYYACQAAVVAAVAIFGYHVYDALNAGGWDGLVTFDWRGQGRVLLLAIGAGLLKAGLDWLTGSRPTQEPAGPSTT